MYCSIVLCCYVPSVSKHTTITSLMDSVGVAVWRIYRQWVQESISEWNKKVLAHAEQLTCREWLEKILAMRVDGEPIYAPHAGSTDPGYWYKDPVSGQWTLKAHPWKSCSLNITTYLWTFQSSICSHLHDLDSDDQVDF